uniref:Uncharacterized protein n=1 Tax=Panagrolaimus superbus TaxID=310955 RepID=A0A914XWG3_9BILA
MQFATSECQYSFAVQILLEISDEEINICENIIEIRRLAMGFIQKIFLTAPNVILTVHYQGYPLKYIPWMVELVPSVYIMVEHMEELIKHFNVERRIFAVYLIAHIVSSLSMPKHVHLAQMILLVVENQMALLEPHEKAIFFFNILPAFEIMSKKLEFVRPQIIGYIQKGIKIAHTRASVYPSMRLAMKQPERIIIEAAKETMQKIQEMQKLK